MGVGEDVWDGGDLGSGVEDYSIQVIGVGVQWSLGELVYL